MSMTLYVIIDLLLFVGGICTYLFVGLVPGCIMFTVWALFGITCYPNKNTIRGVWGIIILLHGAFTLSFLFALAYVLFGLLGGVVAGVVFAAFCIGMVRSGLLGFEKVTTPAKGTSTAADGKGSAAAAKAKKAAEPFGGKAAKAASGKAEKGAKTVTAVNNNASSSGYDWIKHAQGAMSRYQSAQASHDTEAARTAFGEMHQAYKALRNAPQLASDPSYWQVLGLLCTMMAMWCADEGDVDLDAAREYAGVAMDALGKAQAAGGISSKQLGDMATLARTVAAFVAFMQDRREDVAKILKDGPHNAFTLAMLGVVLANTAIDRHDSGTAQGARGILMGMDQCAQTDLVAGGVDSGMREYVLALGYVMYAQVLAYGSNTFPGAGFTDDVAAAVDVLERGRTYLADPEIYADQIDATLAEMREDL